MSSTQTSEEFKWAARLGTGFFSLWLGLAVLASLDGWNALRLLFAQACHQIPARSFLLDGHPVGLCARCCGIYAGLALGHGVFARWRLPESTAKRGLLLAAALVAGDVLFEALGTYDNLKLVRLATGGLLGFFAGWFTLRALAALISRNRHHPIYEPT